MLGGKPYRLNTDFRTGINYAISAASNCLEVADIFYLWFQEIPPVEFAREALDGVNRFYRRKDEPIPEEKEDQDGSSGPIPWDFAADADIITADFMRVYGLDLSAEKIHWWRFMALLEGLYSYNLKDRVAFRIQPLTGMSGKQRSHAIKMREQFAIYQGEENTYQGHLDYLQSIIDKHKND